MRFGLDRMRRLMTALGSPQERFGAIHVVGTNGKSSTVADDRGDPRSATACAPAPTCRRTSSRSPSASASTTRTSRPSASPPPSPRAARAAAQVDRTLEEGDRVTQFEALTAAAYSELAEAGVDVAVVEAGLGGRWDATNVIPSRGAGADERRPRAHALARPDDRRHRAREARRRAPRRRRSWSAPACTEDALRAGRAACARARRAARRRAGRHGHRAARRGRVPAAQLRRRARRGRGLPRARSTTQAVARRGARDARARPLPGRRRAPGDRRSTAPTTRPGWRRWPSRCATYAAGRPLVAVVSRPRRQGRRRRCCASCCRCAPRSSSPRAPTRARCPPATLESLCGQLGGPPARDGGRARAARWRAARAGWPAPTASSLATGSIYLIADLLAPGGRAREVDAVNDEGPSVPRHGRARGDRRGARDPRVLRARLRVRPIVPLTSAHHAAPLGVFGIESDGLDTAINLLDARRSSSSGSRSSTGRTRTRAGGSPTRCSSAARRPRSLFPFVGTIVYMIVRPPEYLDDVRERELEMQAAEARLQESGYLVLPALRAATSRRTSCAARTACASSRTRARAAARPLDPHWQICPYCEAEVPGRAPLPRRRAAPRDGRPSSARPRRRTRRRPRRN